MSQRLRHTECACYFRFVLAAAGAVVYFSMSTTRPFLPLALLAVAVAGCDGGAPSAPTTPAPRTVENRDTPTPGPRPTTRQEPPKPAPTPRPPEPLAGAAPTRAALPVPVEPLQPPMPPEVPPEKLPDAPTAPGCTLVAANPEKTVFIELSADKK